MDACANGCTCSPRDKHDSLACDPDTCPYDHPEEG